MITLLQHADGGYFESALSAAEPWHASYCARHGITYAPGHGSLSVAPMWVKVVRIAQALEAGSDADTLVWLDVDAVIVDQAVSLAEAFPEPWMFGAVLNGNHEFNAGAMWLRVSPESKAFWARVVARGPEAVRGRFRDHRQINDSLLDLPALPLDSRWNHYDFEESKPVGSVVIKAWHNYPPAYSLARVQDLVQALMSGSQ